ncbi:MAG: tetratricopeptide repeat protein [Bryobacteraceae bacterium]
MDYKVCSYAAVVLAFGAFAQSPQQRIASHSRQAQEYLKANRPDLAAREFSAILEIDPNNADARGNLGVLLFFQGGFTKAVPQLREALKLHPGLPKIQALLGMSEKRIGQSASAQADLEKAFPQLQEEKLRIEAGLELIEIYYGAGDLDKAAGIASALRQLKPADPDILYTAHRIYSELADECMLSVAMAAPESARMHQLAGDEMARQGNAEAAIAHYRQALKIDPRIAGLHFRLAEMLNAPSGTASRDEAEKEYKAALADDPFDEKSECRLGEIAFGRSDLKNALAHYSRALELQPNDADANLGIAKTLLSMNQPQQARAPLEHAAQLEPFNAITHYRLSIVYRDLGRPAEARRELAEYQRLKQMKAKLENVYREMRLQPSKPERPDADAPN